MGLGAGWAWTGLFSTGGAYGLQAHVLICPTISNTLSAASEKMHLDADNFTTKPSSPRTAEMTTQIPRTQLVAERKLLPRLLTGASCVAV